MDLIERLKCSSVIAINSVHSELGRAGVSKEGASEGIEILSEGSERTTVVDACATRTQSPQSPERSMLINDSQTWSLTVPGIEKNHSFLYI